MKRIYFYIGLLLFYLLIFFSPNKPIYFSAYIVSTFFFYLGSKNIRESLLYSLILSFFSEIGIAGSLFLINPQELNLGSGWFISPMTIVMLSLIPLSLNKKLASIRISDILIVAFFLWNILLLFIYPYSNVLYGIITLGEILLSYYLLRLYLNPKNLKQISLILVITLFFISLIGIIQFLLKKNIGIIAESSNYYYPFGLTAAEDTNLYRITSIFSHANMFAVVLITLIPFLFLFRGRLITFMKFLSVLVLLFTYSRAAWFIMFLLFIILFFMERGSIRVKKLMSRSKLLKIGLLVLIAFLFLPYLVVRLNTIPVAFNELGSFGTRIKLTQEAVNLIYQYPIFGVGINRFQQIASENPVTDIFTTNGFSAGTKIHNLFLELATEIGLPGLVIFVAFLFSVFLFYYKRGFKNKIMNLSVCSLVGLILISLFHPFYLISHFRLFFLLSAIILV